VTKLQYKSRKNTTMYLVHRSDTCFDQTWASSCWPKDRKDKLHVYTDELRFRSLCLTYVIR